MRSMKYWRVWIFALISALLCGGCFGIVSSKDAEERDNIAHFLLDAYEFPAKVYFDPQSSSTEVIVYEVLNHEEQDRVIDLLTTEWESRNWKPIQVRFMEKEVLHVIDHGNGNTGARRGEEIQLRIEKIR